jgi:hypothetical protein
MNRSDGRLNTEVRQDQAMPVAGIWSCANCGRSIQVLTESQVPKKQAFTCVCGAAMEPGEEHVEVDGNARANEPEVNPDVLKR